MSKVRTSELIREVLFSVYVQVMKTIPKELVPEYEFNPDNIACHPVYRVIYLDQAYRELHNKDLTIDECTILRTLMNMRKGNKLPNYGELHELE